MTNLIETTNNKENRFSTNFENLYRSIEDFCDKNGGSPSEKMRELGFSQRNEGRIHIKESPTHLMEIEYNLGKNEYEYRIFSK